MENFIKVIAYDCDTGYAIIDGENTIPCDKVVDYKGRQVIHLPSNSTLRVWCDKKKADEAIEKDGYLELFYKARVTIGSAAPKIPNFKYLSETEQEEILAIVNRAKERFLEDKASRKKVPMSETEKLIAKIAKMQAKLRELGVTDVVTKVVD